MAFIRQKVSDGKIKPNGGGIHRALGGRQCGIFDDLPENLFDLIVRRATCSRPPGLVAVL